MQAQLKDLNSQLVQKTEEIKELTLSLEDTQTQFDEALETTTMFETELESRNKKVDELTKKSEDALEK